MHYTVHALQGMFVSMDAGLVADVFHGCAYNADAAMEKLMNVQACPVHLMAHLACVRMFLI